MTCEHCGKRWVTPLEMKEFGVCDECRGIPKGPEEKLDSDNKASEAERVVPTRRSEAQKSFSHI